MKCPKCGFFGPDSSDICKKCGEDLTKVKEKLGLTPFRVRAIRSRESQKKEPPPTESIAEEPIDAIQQREGIAGETGSAKGIPRGVSSPVKQEGEGPKDIGIPQQSFDLGPDQQEKPSIETKEEDFQFEPEKEDTFPSPGIEATADIGGVEKDTGLSEETADDFDFPDISKAQPSSIDTDSVKNHDPSTISSVEPEAGLQEPPKAKAAAQQRTEEEIFPIENNVKKPEIELEEELKDGKQTQLLSSKEIEEILQLDASQADDRPRQAADDKSKTELLDEDEIEKLLENIDDDSPTPEKNH